MRADGRIRNAEDLARTVVATRESVPILLGQIATVRTGQALRMGSASENGHEVVVGTAVMRIGGNSRTVSTGVGNRLAEIGRALPVDVVVKPVLNRTELVNSTIATVARNLAEGAVLVIVVLFVLLGNFRAALIAALVIPVTMLLTSIGMLKAEVSANLMSLGALDFGLIVDGAVIIVENALRRLGEAQHGRDAPLSLRDRLDLVAASAREMIRPSVYGQAIIILVYAPLLTFTGVEGKMFEPMALTVIIALVFAFVQAVRIPGTSVDQSQAMQFQVDKMLARQPEVRFAFLRTGTSEIASDPMPPNATDTFVILEPRAEWPDPSLAKAALVERIDKRLSTLPGNAYEITQPIQMRFNELIAGVRGDIAVKVFGDDFGGMNAAADRIAGVLRKTRGAVDVRVEQTEGLPMLDIRPNHMAMSQIGVTAGDVQDTAAIGGREAGMIFEGDRRFPVVIRLSEASRSDLTQVAQIPVPTSAGGFVPLSTVADIAVVDGPNQISRENGKRRVVVQAKVRDRDVASVVADARSVIEAQMKMPPGTYLEWGGQFENLASARDRLLIVVPVCFAVIMLLLYGALGSIRDAVIVFTGVPLALVGGVLALVLRGMPFSVSAAVGFIALSGIAVLDNLVMVSSIHDLMARGIDRARAAHDGALARLRPVAMTALVASLGFVPMALGHGAGAKVQKPLATVVTGGLISATLLTLFVLPTLYARFGGWRGRRI